MILSKLNMSNLIKILNLLPLLLSFFIWWRGYHGLLGWTVQPFLIHDKFIGDTRFVWIVTFSHGIHGLFHVKFSRFNYVLKIYCCAYQSRCLRFLRAVLITSSFLVIMSIADLSLLGKHLMWVWIYATIHIDGSVNILVGWRGI